MLFASRWTTSWSASHIQFPTTAKSVPPTGIILYEIIDSTYDVDCLCPSVCVPVKLGVSAVLFCPCLVVLE